MEKNYSCWVTVAILQAELILGGKKTPTANCNNEDISLKYLENQSPLCSEAVLQEEGALVSCHAVEEDSQHSTQNTFL